MMGMPRHPVQHPPPAHCLTSEPLGSQLRRKEPQQAWPLPSQPSCAMKVPKPTPHTHNQNPARFPISGDWTVSQFTPTACKKMRHVSSKSTTRDRSSVSCQNAFHTKHAKSRQLNDEELKRRPTSAAKHPCRMPESLAPACCCYYYDYPRLDVQGARCTLDKVPGCPPWSVKHSRGGTAGSAGEQ